MTDRNHVTDALDAQLEDRFQALRRSEQASAPDIPATLAAGSNAGNVVALHPPSRTLYRSMPQLAAAVAVLAVGVVMFMQPPEDDPAALYADIMSGNFMQTDALLQVSSSVLPAVESLPQLYDTDFTYDADTLFD